MTAADNPASRAATKAERVNLVCPRCIREAQYDIPAHGAADCACPGCGGTFQTQVLRVQSKRSTGEKKYNLRRFTVRAQDLNGRDKLVEFVRPALEDFEMRSKDLVALSSTDGQIRIVQNLTVGHCMSLSAPKAQGAGCGGAAAVAALLMVVLGFCGMVAGGGSGYDSTPSPALSSYTDNAYATADGLYAHDAINVRTDPGKDGPVVRTLARGDFVKLGPKDHNGWAPLYNSSGTREGYVYRASDAVRSYAPGARRPTTARRASSSTARRSSSSAGSRRSSAASRGYYTGPRGGCYTYSASGRKRYVDRALCN